MSANLQLGIGTSGGTLLGLAAQPIWHNLAHTAALAAVGALVSFLVTLFLQRLLRKRQ